MNLTKLLWVLCLLTTSHSLFAQNIWTVDKNSAFTPQASKVEYLVDTTAQLSFEAVQKASFQKNEQDVLSLKRVAHPVWLRFTMQNNTEQKLWLDLGYNNFGKVFLYEKDTLGKWQVLKHGQDVAFSEKIYPSSYFSFPLSLSKNETKQYYLYYEDCPVELVIPIRATTEKDFFISQHQQDTVLGVCLGIIIIMFVYNLFVYLATLETSYLYYLANMVAVMFSNLILMGYASEWFWSESPEMNYYSTFFLGLSSVFVLIYILLFLEYRKLGKIAYWGGNILLLYAVVSSVICLFDRRMGLDITLLGTFSTFFYCLYYSVKRYRQGFRPAIFLFIAQVFRWTGIILLLMTLHSVLPYELMSRNAYTIGCCLELAFFSLALASRINMYKEEKQKAQALALEKERENAQIIKNQNIQLEQKVSERTAELKIRNVEIEQQNEELTAITEQLKEKNTLVNQQFEEMKTISEQLQEKNMLVNQQYEEMKTISEQLQDKNLLVNEQNEQLSKQNELIEAVNLKLTSSINYAQRIQQAIIPHFEQVQSLIPDSFVLFRPRDIVSGDFYWCSSIKDDKGKQKIVFATADCTGHGVPGAFMSMAGANLLKQIVDDHKVVDPASILKLLHLGIYNLLHQEDNRNQDGMDISISVIDKESKTLEYSGAKRPLYYVQNGEMNQIKGSAYPIGGYFKNTDRQYITETVSFKDEPVMAYTFSDGYPDQIGEKTNRKFLTKHFRQMLHALSSDSLQNQRQKIEQRLDEWQGSVSQVDDILVVGMKLV